MSEDTSEPLIARREGAVGVLELARPEKFNCLSLAVWRSIGTALHEFERSGSGVRVILIQAQGKHFCTGADLDEVQGLRDDATRLTEFIGTGHRVLEAMEASELPIVAACHGLCLAGGLELMLGCDLVFAAESARLGDAHSNFGVFPGAGGAAILPRRIGLNRAKYLLFSGENVSARDMMDWGLVNKVVADEDLRDAVQAFANKLADKSPAVLRRMKAVANRSLDVDETAALSEEMLNLRAHMRSWDMHEGLSAFNEKRKPQFRGY